VYATQESQPIADNPFNASQTSRSFCLYM